MPTQLAAQGLTPQAMIEMVNIADHLPQEVVSQIGQRVSREFDIDKASRSDWERRMTDATDMAMQVAEAKTFPWPGAANVKYPLMTTAAIQFNARAYPAIVNGRDVVQAQVNGKDPTGEKRSRAERVGEHMSYQLTTEMVEWEEDTDRLLVMIPIVGCLHRKTWFDPNAGRNMSVLVNPMDFVVHYKTKALENAPRQTQIFELYPHEIVERQRSGLWREVELGLPQQADGDTEAPHVFLEQHRREDLDDDGYPEPCIVTIHRDTQQVMRITARFDLDSLKRAPDGRVIKIDAVQSFTKYGFIPSPDGGYYDVGFGLLLAPINKMVDTVLNQLIDAGTLANAGGGWMGKSARPKGGPLQVQPGRWQPVDVNGEDLGKAIVPYPNREPSAVLFQLLGMLVEAGKEISAVKDVLTGEAPQGANTPATTTLALIEQGLKVFTAIFKRIFRSLKQELAKLYRLNRLYLPPNAEYMVLDDPKAISQKDYAASDLDITPVSDPSMVTDMQRLGRAQFLMQFIGNPMFDQAAIIERLLEAASIDSIDDLMAKEPPPPPPEAILAQAKMQTEQARVQIEQSKVQIQAAEAKANILNLLSNVVLNLANAQTAEAKVQIQSTMAQMEMLAMQVGMFSNDGQGNVPGMAQGPANGGGAPAPGGPPPGANGAMGGGPVPGAGQQVPSQFGMVPGAPSGPGPGPQ